MEGQEVEHYAALVRALEPVADWVSRIDAGAERPQPGRGSPMRADDDRLDPYQISHSSWHSLAHAVDHLNCLRVLVKDAKVIHMYAPYTLVRGALENACSAVWMLRPNNRAERVTRRLRLAVNDIKHGEEAKAITGQLGPRTKEQRLDQVRETARRCGADETQAMKAAGYKEIVSTASDENDLFVLTWKLCSGIAHGDLWSTTAAAQMVPIQGDAPPGVGRFSISTNLSLLAKLTTLAATMTGLGWQFYDQRSLSPW